jgi:hypothetical protein
MERVLRSHLDKPSYISRINTEGKIQAHTFIRAFESSPVHCLKFRPCLKRRKPGNDGAQAMLYMCNLRTPVIIKEDIPSINIVLNIFCPFLRMDQV